MLKLMKLLLKPQITKLIAIFLLIHFVFLRRYARHTLRHITALSFLCVSSKENKV